MLYGKIRRCAPALSGRLSQWRSRSAETCWRSHHVDAIRLTLGAFLAHELVDRFIQRRGLQVDAHDEEQRPPQRRRANFAHAFVPAGYIAGIVWRSIQPGVGHECFLRVKSPHIPDFSYELRLQSRAYAEHIHDNGIFRQHGSQ